MRFLKTYETNNNKINVTKNHRHEKNTKMSANENDVAHRGGGGEGGGGRVAWAYVKDGSHSR